MTIPSDEELELRWQLREEMRREADAMNPLRGKVERVYFMRGACLYRRGPRKGKVRSRRRQGTEVELLRFLPTRRCVTVKDIHTRGLDRLAEECFEGHVIPPHTDARQLFLEWFRKL